MSNRKDWNLALSVGPDGMNSQTFDSLAENGIHQIELSSGSIDPFYSVINYPRDSKSISRLAKEHGVDITSVHLPFLPFAEIDPSSADPGVRSRFLAVQFELLEAASDACVPYAIVHPSAEPYKEEERKERLSCSIDTLGQLCDKAKSCGIILCLENLPRTCLCRTSDEMLLYLNAIPDLRVVFDTNHSLTEDNVHYIKAIGGKIRSLHVSDYDFIDEKHWLPFEGKINWEEIISALEEVNYGGRFLYELRSGYTYKQIADNYHKLIGSSI